MNLNMQKREKYQKITFLLEVFSLLFYVYIVDSDYMHAFSRQIITYITITNKSSQ